MSNIVLVDIIVDIVLIAIVCGGFIYGAKCGVVKVIEKPLKMLSSFILASIAAIAFSSKLVFPAIKGPIVENVSGYIVKSCEGKEDIPVFYKLMGVTRETIDAGAQSVSAELVEPAALILSVIITFFVVYILGKLILSLIFGLLNLILNFGVLKYISRAAGAVVGVAVFFVISTLVANVFGFCESLGLFKNVAFLSDFTGGFVFEFMINVWSGFFGF